MFNSFDPRPILAVILLFLAGLTSASAQQASSAKKDLSESETAVIKLQRQWLDAYENRDAAAMERIVADDFTITYPSGDVERKPQIIAFLTRQRDPAKPGPKFTTADVESRVYGDIVILIGRVTMESVRGGQTTRETSRYTDVYRKQKGRWQVIASHLSNDTEQQIPKK